jgi:hypothetical protein
MAEWSTLGALGEPTDVIVAPPRNPARAPQGVEDVVYGMTLKPLSDIGMGIGSVVEGQGWNSPEASAGFLAAMGLLTPMRAGALRPGIKAYHGSPYDFDRFDISKIGTGEGAQAYGHGLYFAENPATAKSYRESLKWKGTNWDDPQFVAAQQLEVFGGDKSMAIQQLERSRAAQLKQMGFVNPEVDGALKLLRENSPLTVDVPKGKMYEVSIAAKPEQFLDWDRPLRQMSPEVQKTLNEAWLAHPEAHAGQTGEQIYRNNTPGFVSSGPYREPNHGRASEVLRDAGIPGIRYLDQGSRGQGTGTSNYVLFRDDIIDILRKYGIMAPASGVALDQATQRQ